MNKYCHTLVFRKIDNRFVCLSAGEFENNLFVDVLYKLDNITFPDCCEFARYRTKNYYILIRQYNFEKITIDYYESRYF